MISGRAASGIGRRGSFAGPRKYTVDTPEEVDPPAVASSPVVASSPEVEEDPPASACSIAAAGSSTAVGSSTVGGVVGYVLLGRLRLLRLGTGSGG